MMRGEPGPSGRAGEARGGQPNFVREIENAKSGISNPGFSDLTKTNGGPIEKSSAVFLNWDRKPAGQDESRYYSRQSGKRPEAVSLECCRRFQRVQEARL